MDASLKIIKPVGMLDGIKANELCQQVRESLGAGNNFVLLDMTDVDSIDSSGLGALIISLKMLRTAGGDLYLCSIAEPVKNLLRIAMMDRLFKNQNTVCKLPQIAANTSRNPKLPNVRG